AIYKAVDERLMDPEAGSPDFRPRVSDELDLLHLVIEELQRLLNARTPPPGARTADVPPHVNPLPTSWDKGPAGDEPHRLRSALPVLPTAQQEKYFRYAGFFSED